MSDKSVIKYKLTALPGAASFVYKKVPGFLCNNAFTIYRKEIKLLPALPGAWSCGLVKGLKARGGFEINMGCKNKKITTAGIYSKTGRNTVV